MATTRTKATSEGRSSLLKPRSQVRFRRRQGCPGTLTTSWPSSRARPRWPSGLLGGSRSRFTARCSRACRWKRSRGHSAVASKWRSTVGTSGRCANATSSSAAGRAYGGGVRDSGTPICVTGPQAARSLGFCGRAPRLHHPGCPALSGLGISPGVGVLRERAPVT